MSAHDVDNGLDAAWLGRTAEPVATAQPAPRSIDEMTLDEVRRAMLDLHHRLNVSTLENAALRKSCEVLERAHCTATEALVRKGDEATALRTALGAAEAVIATLRARVAELEAPIARRWTITPAEGAGAALLVTTDRICPSDPCWIARRGDDTALGETEREAVATLAGRLGYVGATVAPVDGEGCRS